MKKWVIIAIIIAAILILGLAIYFLFFTSAGMSYFGIDFPDFSKSANLGNVVGEGTNANTWESAKLNPFRNETS